MKYLISKISARVLLAMVAMVGVGIPAVLFAGPTSFQVTYLTPTHTTAKFSASFEVRMAPSSSTPFYAWVGEFTNKNQLPTSNNSKFLATMTPASPLPFTFGVDFDYASLGLVPGKVYAYALTNQADLTGGAPGVFANSASVNGAGAIVECFTVTDGPVPCVAPAAAPSNTVTPANLKMDLFARGQSDSTAQPGAYIETFNSTPNGTLTAYTDMTLKIFKSSHPNDASNTTVIPVPQGTNTVITTMLDGIEPGLYTGALYIGTKKISNLVGFTITAKATPAPATPVPPVSGTALNATGGASISFPPGKQIVKETSAEFSGILKVSVDMPVSLGYVSGKSGAPLSNERTLITVPMLAKGDQRPVKMTFTGLTAGTTYAFAFVNRQSNQTSSPLEFTTPGGATNEAALFGGQRVGGDQDPTGNIAIDDTISDKGIVPRCGRSKGSPDLQDSELVMCGYKDFLQLISNVMQYMLIIIGPIAAILMMFAGFMIVWLGKIPDPSKEIMDKLRGYKTLMLRIVVGVLIMLLAWTIVATILNGLGVKKEYILLDLFTGK